MSRHNEKRAERFEAAGIGEADLGLASTAYLGDAGGACCLCDTGIKHQYLLTFARESGAVEFFPVGSKCITDWMKAMPESVERQRALETVRAATRTMRAQRAVLKAFEDAEDDDAVNLMRIFFRLPQDVRSDTDEPLGDIGQRVVRFKDFKSDSQRRFFARLVREAAREHGVQARSAPGSGRQRAQAQAEEVSYDDPQDALLAERFQALPEGFAEGRGGALADIGARLLRTRELTDGQRRYFGSLLDGAELLARYVKLPDRVKTGPLGDMGDKLAQFGTFRSPRQRGYFSSLVKRAEEAQQDAADDAEADPSVPPPPPAAPPATPATAPVQGSFFDDGDPDDARDYEGYEDPF